MNVLQRLLYRGCGSRRGGSVLLAMSLAVILLGAGTPARAGLLTITPTFDSSITSLPDAATVEGAINAAIDAVETNVGSPNNISVSIDFQNMSSGLGESITGVYSLSYDGYYNAFKAVATSPLQHDRPRFLGTGSNRTFIGQPRQRHDRNVISRRPRAGISVSTLLVLLQLEQEHTTPKSH